MLPYVHLICKLELNLKKNHPRSMEEINEKN